MKRKVTKSDSGKGPRKTVLGSLTVSGFKSIRSPRTLVLAPLTVLAGANSSGKSSFFQPLLLLKQTLEAPNDPGPLALFGENIRVTNWEQIRPAGWNRPFVVRGAASSGERATELRFEKSHNRIQLVSQKETFRWSNQESAKSRPHTVTIRPNMRSKTIEKLFQQFPYPLPESFLNGGFSISQDRSFLVATVEIRDKDLPKEIEGLQLPMPPGEVFLERVVKSILHVPGLRGSPERLYQHTGVGRNFSGTFDRYVATILLNWPAETRASLNRQLLSLELTSGVTAEQLDDVSVEIKVGLSLNKLGAKGQTVSIADVGFGVSQVLPVLVALLTASTNQIVYIEQPEIHLHPKAQLELAKPIIEATKRGVQVVVETHSALLLRGLQIAVASGEIGPRDLSLNWFSLDPDTLSTKISRAEVGGDGSLGPWPYDFDDIALAAESQLIDLAIDSGD